MTHSASEVAKKLKLSKDTLRYYEKERLIPSIQWNESGHRIYSESDIEWIFLICSLTHERRQGRKSRRAARYCGDTF